MTEITERQITRMAPHSAGYAGKFLPFLNALCPVFGVDTPKRICHFLAQICHESQEFRRTVERASGAAYEFRKALGNTAKGDGPRFKGRGLIQLTGKANYQAYNTYLVGERVMDDVVSHPGLLAEPEHAVRSALWYWATRGLDRLADRDDIEGITRRINGGLNGLESRKGYLKKAWEVFVWEEKDLGKRHGRSC